MERKIKAIRCIRDNNDHIKDKIYPIQSQTDNVIYWNYIHSYNIGDFNSDFWTTHFEVIYEDKISSSYPILTEEDCIVGAKVTLNTNIEQYKKIKKNNPSWPEISEIVVTNTFVGVKDFKNTDGSFFTFIRNCFTKSLLLVEPAKKPNTKKVTISNCKVGDKVIRGKDFKGQEGCSLNISKLGYDIINYINVDKIYLKSGYYLTINDPKYKDLELLIFYEEDKKQISHNFKTNNIIKNENKIINLSPVTSTITRGKKLTGNSISSRPGRIRITIKHLGNKQVSC